MILQILVFAFLSVASHRLHGAPSAKRIHPALLCASFLVLVVPRLSATVQSHMVTIYQQPEDALCRTRGLDPYKVGLMIP